MNATVVALLVMSFGIGAMIGTIVALLQRWHDNPWRVANLVRTDLALLYIGREMEEQRYAELTGCNDALLRECKYRLRQLQLAIQQCERTSINGQRRASAPSHTT